MPGLRGKAAKHMPVFISDDYDARARIRDGVPTRTSSRKISLCPSYPYGDASVSHTYRKRAKEPPFSPESKALVHWPYAGERMADDEREGEK